MKKLSNTETELKKALLIKKLIFGQRTFFSIIKIAFRGKPEFYLFYYNAIFKDGVLFKQTQSSIEIDVIVVKKYVFLNFVEKHVRLKRKKKLNVIITIVIEYA